MAIPYRLKRLLQHRCDIYKPAELAAIPGKKEAQDVSIQVTPVSTNVLSYCQSTPEFDEARPQGLTKQTNVFTSDKWWFLQEQEIADGWYIVMKTPGHPDYGKVWNVQGGSTPNASTPGRDTHSQWVFAKISPKQQIAGL